MGSGQVLGSFFGEIFTPFCIQSQNLQIVTEGRVQGTLKANCLTCFGFLRPSWARPGNNIVFSFSCSGVRNTILASACLQHNGRTLVSDRSAATATAVTATGIRREGEYEVLAHMINQADLPQGPATYLHELLHRAIAHSNEEPQANSLTAIETPRRWTHFRLPEIGDPDTEYSEEVHDAANLRNTMLSVTTGLAESAPDAAEVDPSAPIPMPDHPGRQAQEEAFTAEHALIIYNAFDAMANHPRSMPDSDGSDFSSAPPSEGGTHHQPRSANRRDGRTGAPSSAQAEWIETIGDETETIEIADTPTQFPPTIRENSTEWWHGWRIASLPEGKRSLRSLWAIRRHALASKVSAGRDPGSSNNAVQARQQEDPNQGIESERQFQREELARSHDEHIETRRRRALATDRKEDIEADVGESSTDEEKDLGRFLPLGYDFETIATDATATFPRSIETTEDHTGVYILDPWGYEHFIPTKFKGASATPFATGTGCQVFANEGKGKRVRNETMHSSIVGYDHDLVTAAWKIVLSEAHQRWTKYRRSGSPSSLSRHIQQNYLLTERTLPGTSTGENQAYNPGSSSDAPSVDEPMANTGSSSIADEPPGSSKTPPLVRSDFINTEEESERGVHPRAT